MKDLTPDFCEKGYEDVIEVLISAGANTQLQTDEGYTAKALARENAHRNKYGTLTEGVFSRVIESLTLPGHIIDAD